MRLVERARGVLAIGVVLVGCSGEILPAGSRRSPASHDPAGESAAGGTSAAGVAAGRDNPVAGMPAAVAGSAGKDGQDPGAAALDCTELQVGATPLQRLGRAQYGNAVRDLLNVSVDVRQLPEDEKFGVFDGNTVVPVTDLVLEQYIGAAELTARLALPDLAALVPCDRAALGEPACAKQFIEAFGLRTYRRPLEAEEVSRYQALFTAFQDQGYADRLRVIVQTMLQSPNFLYRVELMPASAGGGTLEPLDAYELATRLSFFLLSTTPDDRLLEVARSGTLTTPEVLMSEADRLLADARLSDTLASFHLQWLELNGLDSLSRDQALFPAFTPELGPAMRAETLRFVDYVMREGDGRFDTLLTAPYSFPEGPVLALYGLDGNAGMAGEPVALDPAKRAGLLTQPAFLTAHSHYNQASPVQRGKIIIRNVLCQTLPDPPPGVNPTPSDPSADATTRERLLVHQDDPSCAGCHVRIDGIGFGFEHYDAIGAFRSTESGKAIDASGEIFGTEDSDGAFDGAVQLAQRLADSADAQRCLTTQWLRFALGRLEADADRCTIENLYREFAAGGRDMRALLRSIVMSDAFRSKLVPEESAP